MAEPFAGGPRQVTGEPYVAGELASPTGTSPILSTAGAVPTPPPAPGSALLGDDAVAWHYGDPFAEQRAASTTLAVVDRSHRPLITIDGADRLTWLHALISQHVSALPDGTTKESLILDVNGRVEDHFTLTDLGGRTWLDTDPARGAALLTYLRKMVFWAQATPAAADDFALLTLIGPAVESLSLPEVTLPAAGGPAVALPGGGIARRAPWPGEHAVDLIVPRAQLAQWWTALTALGARPAGLWAFEALRVLSLQPRVGVDTDERTIPHETRWIDVTETVGAVHLNKGCYRGQETVARVHNLGKPPRHVALLHLDGSADTRPQTGDPVTAAGRTVGRVGTVVEHFEYGPVALALIKRTIPVETPLLVGSADNEVAASIDPDSVPEYGGVQAGRAAVDRLRGR